MNVTSVDACNIPTFEGKLVEIQKLLWIACLCRQQMSHPQILQRNFCKNSHKTSKVFAFKLLRTCLLCGMCFKCELYMYAYMQLVGRWVKV